MLYIYYAILAAVFFATIAMSIDKGLWGNTLTTVNILLSGLVAFGFYMPLARLASEKGGEEFTYLLDFTFLWMLYVLAFIILHRLISGALSTTRMRFKHPIDTIGGPVMAVVAGWLMTAFVAATLHAAPFERECFGGKFTEGGRSPATSPDVLWLNIAQRLLSQDHMGTSSTSFTLADYTRDFGSQRAALEKEESLRVKR
ncbi:MAG: CvpA family protein [Aeoliella sp.]